MSQYPSSRTITVGWEGYKLGRIEANFPENRKKRESILESKIAISCVLVLKVQTEKRGRKSRSTPAGRASNRLRRGRGRAKKQLPVIQSLESKQIIHY